MKNFKFTLLTLLLPLIAMAQEAPQITTSDTLHGTVGMSEFWELHSDQNATWSVEGDLPEGFVIASSYDLNSNFFHVSGTPVAAGELTFTLKVTNSAGSSTKTFTAIIGTEQSPPVITTAPLDSGEMDEFYFKWLESTSIAEWSIASGDLPPGLYIEWSYIRGTPITGGVYTFTVRATNDAGYSEKTITIAIKAPVPQITTSDTLDAVVGKRGQWQLSSDQYVIWSVEGDLPEGFRLQDYGNYYYTYIYGTPTEVGELAFTLRVTNSMELYTTKTFIVKVVAPELPVITTNSLDNGIMGESYSQTIEAADYAQWSRVSGSLPPGLSIENTYNGYGEIYGYPTTEGTYNFTVKATNVSGSTEKTFSITIGGEQSPPKITDYYLPDGTEGTSYWGSINSDRGANWSITGDLPPGLYLESYEDNYRDYINISGTPTAVGTYSFTVKATNSIGSHSANYSITIAAETSPPTITSIDIQLSATVDQNYWGSISSDRGANWSITGDLPPGLSIENSSNSSYSRYFYISGTPTTAGEFTFEVIAANSIGSDSREFTVTIELPPPPQITSSGSLNAVVGKQEQWQLRSNQRVIWSVEGDLPSGFRLQDYGNNDYTYIYGTPKAAGELTFKIKVTNSAGLSDTKTFTVNVAVPELPEITTASPLRNGTIGESYSKELEAADYAQWSKVSGSLPPGLSLNSSGEIYGTPTTADTYNFTVKATNVSGYSEKTFAITIGAETSPPVITYDYVSLSGVVGKSYSGSIDSDRAAYWSITGDLPPGLSIENSGNSSYSRYFYISGTPTQVGEFTFKVIATNPKGSDSTAAFTVKITMPNEPVIATDALENGTMGESYSQRLEAADYAQWSIASGSLPPGLSLNSYGDIYGTPTAAGTYNFTVKATNAAGSKEKPLAITIDVEQSPPVITSASIPLSGVAGMSYNGNISSNRAANWSITGNLPPGLSIENSSNSSYSRYFYISGTPTTAGEFTFKVKATNPKGSDSTAAFTVKITMPNKPVIATASLENGKMGESYSQNIGAADYAQWSIASGSLPPGLELYSYSDEGYYGRISGYPAKAGVYSFTVKAANATGFSLKSFTITIDAESSAPVIATASLSNGAEGQSYWKSIYSDLAAQWSIASGSLPPGLSLESYDNDYTDYVYISGYPTRAGTYNFAVKAKNSKGSDSIPYTIIIAKAQQKPVIATISLPNSAEGESYDESVSSDLAANWSIASGSLPPGLYLDNEGDDSSYTNYFYIYGYPTTEGTYSFTLKATNSVGSDSVVYSITIAAAQQKPVIATASLPNTMVGDFYETRISSDKAANWSIASGSLPPGLELYASSNDEGYRSRAYISGYPTTVGTYSFTVKATNSKGSDSIAYTIKVESYTEEICEAEGKVWENNACWTAAKLAETACEEAGRTWLNNNCWTAAELAEAEAACVAANKVWLNGQCKEATVPIHAPQIAASQIRAQSIANGIMLQNLPQNAKIEVYNLQGRQIYSATSHSPLTTSLNIPVSARGMYIVKVSLGSQKHILRVPVK